MRWHPWCRKPYARRRVAPGGFGADRRPGGRGSSLPHRGGSSRSRGTVSEDEHGGHEVDGGAAVQLGAGADGAAPCGAPGFPRRSLTMELRTAHRTNHARAPRRRSAPKSLYRPAIEALSSRSSLGRRTRANRPTLTSPGLIASTASAESRRWVRPGVSRCPAARWRALSLPTGHVCAGSRGATGLGPTGAWLRGGS